jgi:hypothetical protein
MRGGALAPFFWALLLATLGVLNLIWTKGDIIQVGEFAGATGFVLLLVLLLIRLSPEARRRGAPPPSTAPEAVPASSLAAVAAALGFACLIFGFAFGRFPIFLGAGVLILAVGRLCLEFHAQRSASRHWTEGEGS